MEALLPPPNPLVFPKVGRAGGEWAGTGRG